MRTTTGILLLLALVGCAADSTSISDDEMVADQEIQPVTTGRAKMKKRLTGGDLDTSKRWKVGGTDLGIPYVLENGSIGYLFGDTFSSAWPGGEGWRSPVMLRSKVHPKDGIVFDSAAKVKGDGFAPELIPNAHNTSNRWGSPPTEFTVIPNDGVSFPETKRQVVSFMSINNWDSVGGANWRSGYASLAYSDNGNDFKRADLSWPNNEANTDPFQMWTMQRDGDYVYVFSVRAGRQKGPMMLQRVKWQKILEKSAYEGWGYNGKDWGWGRPCTAIMNGRFGEPSVRKLEDGTWAMAYLNLDNLTIVTRTAKTPDGKWSSEKAQVTWQDANGLYGGFIHPWSKSGKDNLHLIVSQWTFGPGGQSTAYHSAQWVGSL